MNNINIDGKKLRTMVLTGASKLDLDKNEIDSLNVFPVPDGDTGTNMALTLASAANAVEKLPENPSMAEVANALSLGALMGARGNSGVILSQLLGGFAKIVGKQEKINSVILSQAFSQGVEDAYKAVVKPIEGTILTVARESSEKLAEKINKNINISTAFEILINQAEQTLIRTPEMLPVLKQAGVVDAGGKGFLTFLQGMFYGFNSDEFNYKIKTENNDKTNIFEKDFKLDENIEFQYCTELIIKKSDNSEKSMQDIRNFLEDKGDCVLVVGSEKVIKVHVHTNNPGLVLEYCCAIGSLNDIKIDNLYEQSKEMQVLAPEKDLGVVAVSVGEGLNEIFRSLGVDSIITGGQTMNPSTEDILEAIKNVNAKNVLILPNNKNIILAAQQAVKISNKSAGVVLSKTIPQGIGALMAFNAELDLNENISRMQEAVKNIKTGEVTYAVRNAQHGDLIIKEGQTMGILDGEINYLGNTPDEVVFDLLQKELNNEEELVTIYYGENISEEQAEELVDKLALIFGNVDFELHCGGQPLYNYLISIE